MAHDGMLVFDLSLSGKKAKLPAVSSWLNPSFSGPGDLLLPQHKSKNDPKNWKKDFPDYIYKYDELLKIKTELNTTKHLLDAFRKNPKDSAAYDTMSDLVRPHDSLRGARGVLVQEFNAEIVTNAWLKMFEAMLFVDPILEKINKKRDDKHFNSMHIAEAPGNFMLAINHYLRTNYPLIVWEWIANSYRDVLAYSRDSDPASFNSHYLEDQYGLIQQYKDRWIFGADAEGDITSVANLRTFHQEVQKRFGGELHFMTSDVKYVPLQNNFDEEENINVPVHMGHLLCALMCLAPGGAMMLKEFTFFEPQSVSLLYLMACCFEQLLIVKPETSRPANSEVYIVGVKYKGNLTPVQIEHLLNVMNYVRYLNTEDGSPSLFLQSDIPKEFVEKVVQMSRRLADHQIQHLKRNVELFKKYKNTPPNRIREDMHNAREKAAREWIAKMKIKPLAEKDHIAAKKQAPQKHSRERHFKK